MPEIKIGFFAQKRKKLPKNGDLAEFRFLLLYGTGLAARGV